METDTTSHILDPLRKLGSQPGAVGWTKRDLQMHKANERDGARQERRDVGISRRQMGLGTSKTEAQKCKAFTKGLTGQ